MEAAHDAVTEKLEAIRLEHGEQRQKEVIANIILAKQQLKERHVYKKLDGGFGGIGVENWILQNGGSFINALTTLRNAAYEEGQLVDYKTFQKRYAIHDAGINVRDNRHDNFSRVLTEEGYKKLAQATEEILVEYGLESVRKN